MRMLKTYVHVAVSMELIILISYVILGGRRPYFLSKGLRQRVAIASILTLRSQVIIVDEPTTGQDLKR
jgi:energy-coupling factor transporter ATP-binding protein EcfA2